MKPLVYLAGPYTHPDPVINVHDMCQTATRLVEDDVVTPVVPHLSMLWHLVTPRPIEFWYRYDLELLERCDALVRLPGKSAGATHEFSHAAAREIPTFTGADWQDELYRWAWSRDH